jgi:hypothetical protein
MIIHVRFKHISCFCKYFISHFLIMLSVLLWWQSWISKWQNRQLCWVQMKRLQHVDKGILNKYILKASVSTTFYFTQRAIKSNGNILFVNEIWTAVSKIQLYMSLYLNNMLIGVCILLFMHRLCSIQFSFWVNNILFMFQFKMYHAMVTIFNFWSTQKTYI